MNVECASCRVMLFSAADVCFFSKGELEVSLIVKPERMATVLSAIYIEQDQYCYRAKCKNCKNNVGCQVPYGPDGAKYVALATEKVVVCGVVLSRKTKWRNSLSSFPHISSRDNLNFYGPAATASSEQKPVIREQRKCSILTKATEDSHFEWKDLLLLKTPRMEQVQAYIEVLQRDCIVVMPTGSGKTLVAALVMGRFSFLNPLRLAVMVVDRIPLVFQQAAALEADTGMKVAKLCSENKTQHTIQSLVDCEYEALVITAGSLIELINAGKLNPDFFSVVVFDECHHVSGEHVYSRLLRVINKLPLSSRPRLLGLSASPFPAKCFNTAQKNMLALRDEFSHAVIFKPSLPPPHQQVIWRVVDSTPAQISFKTAVIERLLQSAEGINRITGDEFICQRDIQMELWYLVRGQVRQALDMCAQKGDSLMLKNLCKEVHALLAAIELCNIVSISAAMDLLREESVSIHGRFISSVESPRLLQLQVEISQAADDAKILVFVDTREAARVLRDQLARKFPKLNPQRVVGHGGYDGMDWHGQQEEAITSLVSGHSRLLVSTSVLEEGLDIPACDLVVRFCGGASLIQFVQSRGRARKAGSRLVSILTRSDEHRVAELEAQERIMDSVINAAAQVDQLPSQRTRQLMDSARQRDPRNTVLDSVSKPSELDEVESCASALRVFIEGEVAIARESFQSELVQAFEQSGHIKVCRIQTLSRAAARLHASPRVFGDADSVVLIGVKPSHAGIGNGLAELSSTWDFRIRNRPVWIDVPNQQGQEFNNVLVQRVTVGFMLSRSAFDERGALRPSELAGLSFGNEVIELSFEWKRVLVPISTLNSCGILSADRHSGTCRLFLPLSSVPIVQELHPDMLPEEIWTRVVAEDLDLQLLSTHPVLCFETSLADWRKLCSILSRPMLGISFFVGRVTTRHGTVSLCDLLESVQIRALRWSIGAIASDWTLLISPDALSDLINAVSGVSEEVALAALEQLALVLVSGGSLWDSLVLSFEAIVKSVVFKQHSIRPMEGPTKEAFYTVVKPYIEKSTRLQPFESPIEDTFKALVQPFVSRASPLRVFDNFIPNNYTVISRVAVTPSRIIVLASAIMQLSRFLRRFVNKRIVLVCFRDEQLQTLRDQPAVERIESLIDGGIRVLGEELWFVCASASQMRDHSAFFIIGSQREADDMRRSLLPVPPAETAKHMSRLGLFCTADEPVCQVPLHRAVEVPDVRVKGGLCTDGSGFVNRALADALRTLCHSPTAVAFQFRYSAMKGVVLDHTSPAARFHENSDDSPRLYYRPSMKKADSSDSTFCLVKTAKFTPLRLNRDVLTLLSCMHGCAGEMEWDMSAAVYEMQEHELSLLSRMLYDPVEAARRLSSYSISAWVTEIVTQGINLCTEPFWMRLLRVAYKRAIRSLRTKTHLPVEKGCLLMGVPDPVGLLGSDEVSVRFRRPFSEKVEVVSGPVLIYRNPCLHPGDLRVVMAVDKPELSHLVDVVVLPVTGYSLASACSGGDLDGDMFALIWDDRLVPPKSSVFAPLDYDNIASEAGRFVPESTLKCSMAQFFVRVISNDTLGRVAHLHLALCDILPNGAADPLAMELAKSQSLAVDFPKTGIAPRLPEKAVELVKAEGYPDFMEKPRVESYTSKKLLGHLYRRCLSLAADTLDVVEEVSPTEFVSLSGEDKDLLAETELVYAMYVHCMRRIMARFGLRSEAEVVLGESVHWHPLHASDRGKASRSLRHCWQAVYRSFRDEFYSGEDVNIREKARLWYQVAYSQPRAHAFLSFAWLAGTTQCALSSTPSMASVLGSSALAVYLSTRSTRRLVLSGLLSSFEKIKEGLSGRAEVCVFGSVALFLCDEDSDLDLFVRPLRTNISTVGLSSKEQQTLFLDELAPLLDPIVTKKRSIFDTVVPIIRCSLVVEEVETRVDLCANIDGLSKAALIGAHYRARPEILPLFTLLVEWARACGVLRCAGIDCTPLLCGGEFHAVILQLLNLQGRQGGESPPTYDEVVWAPVDSEALGALLLAFFKAGSELFEEFSFLWPVSGSPVHRISRDTCRQLATECRKMLHALSFCCSWGTAVEHCSLKAVSGATVDIQLSRSLSHHLQSALEFHAARLAHISGADVTLETGATDVRVRVQASGSRLQLRRLREELRRLTRVGHSICHVSCRNSAYFMDGSTFLFARGMKSRDASVNFDLYTGGYQRLHSFKERNAVVLRAGKQPLWEPIFIREFQRKVHTQLSALRGQPTVPSLFLSVHFGNFYITGATTAFSNRLSAVSIGELEAAIAANRRSRRSSQDRAEWSLEDVNGRRSSQEPTKGGIDLEPQPLLFTRRRSLRKIGSSFYPCIAPKTPGGERELLVVERLLALGFVAELQPRAEAARDVVEYKVDMSASSSYIVEVRLDADMGLISVSEKPLAWVHGTLLRDGDGDIAGTDVRIKISTTKGVHENSDLFSFAFPSGPKNVPIFVNADGHVQPSPSLPPDIRERIFYVRKIKRRLRFVMGDVIANVTAGEQFEGRNLELSDTFCELSLDISPEPLKLWCNFTKNDADLNVWLQTILTVIIKISESMPK